MDKIEIRDAATIILVRDAATAPRILMGQRGAKATFMPNKFVFPGGAVDDADTEIPLERPLPEIEQKRLSQHSVCTPNALAIAAIRELWEETGQILGTPAPWRDAPADWYGFADAGQRPDAAGLRFVFRAVTPQGNPRRFDARFFLADAEQLSTDPDDFSNAQDELSHLQWVPLSHARDLNLPFITEVVLAEISVILATVGITAPVKSVPFFRNGDAGHSVLRLGEAESRLQK